jgi:hypothetical protein
MRGISEKPLWRDIQQNLEHYFSELLRSSKTRSLETDSQSRVVQRGIVTTCSAVPSTEQEHKAKIKKI